MLNINQIWFIAKRLFFWAEIYWFKVTRKTLKIIACYNFVAYCKLVFSISVSIPRWQFNRFCYGWIFLRIRDWLYKHVCNLFCVAYRKEDPWIAAWYYYLSLLIDVKTRDSVVDTRWHSQCEPRLLELQVHCVYTNSVHSIVIGHGNIWSCWENNAFKDLFVNISSL